MSRTEFNSATFSKDIPNKIGNGIEVSGKNTLIKTERNGYRVAIADEPIDAKVDGKKMFCVRVDNAGPFSMMAIGFTPLDSNKNFAGTGILLGHGYLIYPVDKFYNIIDNKISHKAKEIIVILTISNNGKKKEIHFLCDGHETKSTDVSGILKEDLLFPAIVLGEKNQQITTIPIDEIKTRTPEIDELVKEYQQQPKNFINIEQVKQARKDLLKQNEEMMMNFFNQLEQQQVNACDAVEAETKKEKKTKQAKDNEDETEPDGSRAEPPQLLPIRRDREEKEQDGNSVRGSSLTADGSKQ